MRVSVLSLVANLVFSLLFVLVTLEILAASTHRDLAGWPVVGNWIGHWPTAAWKILFLVILMFIFSMGAVLRFPNLAEQFEEVSGFLRSSPGEESRLETIANSALLILRTLAIGFLVISPIILIGVWYYMILEVDTDRLNDFQVIYSFLAYVFYLFYVWLQRGAEN